MHKEQASEVHNAQRADNNRSPCADIYHVLCIIIVNYSMSTLFPQNITDNLSIYEFLIY